MFSATPPSPPRLPHGARALVTGLDGQDGFYLARLLRQWGCEIIGGVWRRDSPTVNAVLADVGPVELFEFELSERDSVESMIELSRPDVVYHLAAQSSVGLSWMEPVPTAQTNAMGTLYLLGALRRFCPQAAFVLAGSCDCFDHQAAGERGLTPETPFKATNPYAVTKVMAHQLTRCYRDHFGMRASVAIFFNHTSPRRPEHFVERGVVRAAVATALGLRPFIEVGNLETRRDWSWAEDLMLGFAMLGALDQPAELVLASGRVHTVGDWVREAFRQLGLDMDRHVRIDPGRVHPGERPHTFGNIEQAQRLLGWSPQTDLPEMVRRLIEADRKDLERPR